MPSGKPYVDCRSRMLNDLLKLNLHIKQVEPPRKESKVRVYT